MNNQQNKFAQNIKAVTNFIIVIFFLLTMSILAWPHIVDYLNLGVPPQPPTQLKIVITPTTQDAIITESPATVQDAIITESPATVIELAPISPQQPTVMPTAPNGDQHPITATFSQHACEQASNNGRRTSPRCGNLTPTPAEVGR